MNLDDIGEYFRKKYSEISTRTKQYATIGIAIATLYTTDYLARTNIPETYKKIKSQTEKTEDARERERLKIQLKEKAEKEKKDNNASIADMVVSLYTKIREKTPIKIEINTGKKTETEKTTETINDYAIKGDFIVQPGEYRYINTGKSIEEMLNTETLEELRKNSGTITEYRMKEMLPILYSAYTQIKPSGPITFDFVAALARMESSFDKNAASYRKVWNEKTGSIEYRLNAVGLMQIVGTTWREMTDIPFSKAYDPKINAPVGILYLCKIHEQLKKELPGYTKLNIEQKQKILVGAYHDGPNKVIAEKGLIARLSPEAQTHIRNVTKILI